MSLPTFSFSTTAEEIATTFAAEVDGKNVLITGTSINGIGFETARVIAKYANLVIITDYIAERLKLSEDAFKTEVPSANIRRLSLDLSSLARIRKAVAEVNAYPEPLHVLIHIAAAPIGPFKLTVDNLENQIATGHIGPFLLTKLLALKILAAGILAPGYVPRVVFVSSSGQAMGTGVDFTAIQHPDPAKHTPFGAYFLAKTANVLTAIALSTRSSGRINAYSADRHHLHEHKYQGGVNRRDAGHGILGPDGKPNQENCEWKTISQGAATTVAAAFHARLNAIYIISSLANKPGAYLSNSVEAKKDLARHSSDPAIAAKLWTVTEEIIGEKFTF
ncbi:hypothetical protein FB451DRAFT_1452447 [Mycena latifolia]|nr:hypothetical protein FB451DRAFT_1452447 [Mycena latifolia]